MAIHTAESYPRVTQVLLDGNPLERVVWVDDQTGEYEQYTGECGQYTGAETKTHQVDPSRLTLVFYQE